MEWDALVFAVVATAIAVGCAIGLALGMHKLLVEPARAEFRQQCEAAGGEPYFLRYDMICIGVKK